MSSITRSHSFTSSSLTGRKKISRLSETSTNSTACLAAQLLELVNHPPERITSSTDKVPSISRGSLTSSFRHALHFGSVTKKKNNKTSHSTALKELQQIKYSSLHLCLCKMEQELGFFATLMSIQGYTPDLPKIKSPVTYELADILLSRARSAMDEIQKIMNIRYVRHLQIMVHTAVHDVFAATTETSSLVDLMLYCWNVGAPTCAVRAAAKHEPIHLCKDVVILISEQGDALSWDELPSRFAPLNIMSQNQRAFKLGLSMGASLLYGVKLMLHNLPSFSNFSNLITRGLGRVRSVGNEQKICVEERVIFTLLAIILMSRGYYPTHPEDKEISCFDICLLNSVLSQRIASAETAFRASCIKKGVINPRQGNGDDYPCPVKLKDSSILPSCLEQRTRAKRWIAGEVSSLM